jgi:hypothetical protein
MWELGMLSSQSQPKPLGQEEATSSAACWMLSVKALGLPSNVNYREAKSSQMEVS